MTREEAIEIINRENDPNDKKVWEVFPEYREALDMAIKALSKEPSRDIEEIAEIMKSYADAETKCKMISNILTAKPHYFELSQEPCETSTDEPMTMVYPTIFCDDAISREAILKKQYRIDDSATLSTRDVVNVEDIEDELSVTQKSGEWIPISERLPEDNQNVLFCDIDNDIMVGYHVKGRPNTHFSQDGTWEDIKNVKAWMPLPKPYEPQESEDKE